MAVPLPPDLVAMIARGVSVIVASRDAALRPNLMRAVGSRIEDDGSTITVYLARRQSRQVVQDLAATGHIAVVFSEPSTHRSLQLKATRVEMRSADAGDTSVLERYAQAMEREIQQVGFAPPLTRAMLAHRLDDLVAVRFTPEHAFDQTPGPRAGTPLAGTP
jgi:hypothetical protein